MALSVPADPEQQIPLHPYLLGYISLKWEPIYPPVRGKIQPLPFLRLLEWGSIIILNYKSGMPINI